ncbi:MAG: hypothetical protein U0235_32775 [Polyangiaceae bacterium]
MIVLLLRSPGVSSIRGGFSKLGVALAILAGCHSEGTRQPAPSSTATATAAATGPATAPGSGTATPTAPSSPPKADACAAYVAAREPRKLYYWRVGDPAAHPGCTLLESGDLQCAEDFAGWTPKSKVVVPSAEARAALDATERASFAAECGNCPASSVTGRTNNYPPWLCKGKTCVLACGDARARLDGLRARFASTQTATTVKLAD